MEIDITSNVNNILLNRTEVRFTVTHKGEKTPSRDIIRSELADKLNVKKEDVIIKTVRPGFGNHRMKGYAKVYTSADKYKGLEPDYILIRNKLMEKKEKKPAGEKPAKAPPQKEIAKEEPAKPAKPVVEAKEQKPVKEPVQKPQEKKESK